MRVPSISFVLRQRLLSSRLSWAAIEQATGVDRASLSRFATGERSLRLDVADRLAAFLGLTLTQGADMTGVVTPNVFVYSAASDVAREHYQQTMVRGLTLAQVVGFLTDADKIHNLRDSYPEGVTYLWGARAGGPDEGYWDQMGAGDLFLCYRDRRIVSYSFFVEKVRNILLGQFAWVDAHNRPFDLIYFLTAPTDVDKPIAELATYLGEIYQGLRRVSKSEKIMRDFGSLEAFAERGLR